MNKVFQLFPMTSNFNKNLFLKVLFCLILCGIQLHSLAAATDSIRKKKVKIYPKVKFIHEDAFKYSCPDSQYQKVDTVLDGIEIFNPALQKSFKYAGNLGTATESNLFVIRN